jgi:hypothetical protein
MVKKRRDGDPNPILPAKINCEKVRWDALNYLSESTTHILQFCNQAICHRLEGQVA